METITRADLFAMFLAESGKSAKMIGIHTTTDYSPEKKNCTVKSRVNSEMKFATTFGTNRIMKCSELTVQINAVYENAVNNRLEKDGQEAEFKTKELAYGEYIEGSRILIKHEKDGQTIYYARVYQTNSVLGKSAKYFKASGQPLTDKETKLFTEEFMKLKPEFVKSQGLNYEEAAKPTNYNLDSITQLNINGKQYRITD